MNENLYNLRYLEDAREARDQKNAQQGLLDTALQLEKCLSQDQSRIESPRDFLDFVTRFGKASKGYDSLDLVIRFEAAWEKCESLGVFETMNQRCYDQLKKLKNRVHDFIKLKDPFLNIKLGIKITVAALGIIGTALYVSKEKNFWPFDNEVGNFDNQGKSESASAFFIRQKHTHKDPELRINLPGRQNLEVLTAEDLEKLFALEDRFIAMNEAGDDNYEDLFDLRDAILQRYGIKVVWFFSKDEGYVQFWYLSQRDTKNTLGNL